MSDTASPVLPAPAKVRPKVLVVDDELGPRESISYLLQEEFEVVAVDRVDHGLEQIKQGNFACVIMDIRMPQKNGIQGLEAMRKIDPEVSIIMMTGYGALATAQAAISLGANEYLKKPFDVDVLQQAVRRHVAEGIERKKRTGMLSQLESMYESVMTEQKKQQLSSGFSQAAAAMVHDICNPLVVSIGYTNMLLDEVRQLPPAGRAGERILQYAETLEKCASFCLHLAESWRQTTRHANEVDTVDLYETAVETKGVLFFGTNRIEVTGSRGGIINGIRFELVRLLQNLIKNALEAGASQVTVSVERRDRSVILAIADNGSGLPPAVMESILKKPIESTKAHGTGLGMTICRHIVSVHRGEMKVGPRPGGGTVFTVTFPEATTTA
ncbi:hybrid sensor histidine kinase/response regulator [Oleiharenicola lentus]|uniref:histidine kinase n=1 Tax=Oleiharenicola lentus TaxID=2508720 RepID=A0A4Q1C4U5_9BACT|nr:hybrid sensor histidine kinase/response regulator [Oleiharenicola lentus]RXK53289.1 hybrid sensor histidine kinase/response regulator [Oleiharenicola lentus]